MNYEHKRKREIDFTRKSNKKMLKKGLQKSGNYVSRYILHGNKRWNGSCSVTAQGLEISDEYESIFIDSLVSRDSCCCTQCRLYPSLHRSPYCDNYDKDVYIQTSNIDDNDPSRINVKYVVCYFMFVYRDMYVCI